MSYISGLQLGSVIQVQLTIPYKNQAVSWAATIQYVNQVFNTCLFDYDGLLQEL